MIHFTIWAFLIGSVTLVVGFCFAAIAHTENNGTRLKSAFVAAAIFCVALIATIVLANVIKVFWLGQHLPNRTPVEQFRTDVFASCFYGGLQAWLFLMIAGIGVLLRRDQLPSKSCWVVAAIACGASLGHWPISFLQLILLPVLAGLFALVATRALAPSASQ